MQNFAERFSKSHEISVETLVVDLLEVILDQIEAFFIVILKVTIKST